jgi:hypothetical protein
MKAHYILECIMLHLTQTIYKVQLVVNKINQQTHYQMMQNDKIPTYMLLPISA